MRRWIIAWAVLACALLPGSAAAQTGRISGRVTNTAGVALPNVRINFYTQSGSSWSSAASAVTDWNGDYVRPGLAPGQYALKTTNPSLYVDEAYPNVPCISSIYDCAGFTTVTVAAGASVTNVDFALAVGGYISGQVTDTNGTGIAGVSVYLYLRPAGSSNYTSVTSGYTDGAGAYLIPRGLTTGTYYLLTSNSLGYVDEAYNNAPCVTSIYDCTGAVGVAVTQGTPTANINFALATGGWIAGNVTSTAGVALPNVSVSVYQQTGSGSFTSVASASTDASGFYFVTHGLPAGTYYVRTSNSAGYFDEVYNDVPCASSSCLAAGTGVSVTQGAATPIDFALAPGGRISGRVTNASGFGLPSVTVRVYQAGSGGSYSSVTSVSTDALGNYTTTSGLPSGTYYLLTSNSAGYLDEVYNDIPCAGTSIASCPTGTGVSVTTGATTPNINFSLAVGGQIWGRVTDASGNGLSGVSVSVYAPASGGGYSSVTSASTDSAGYYVTRPGLSTGTYYLRTSNTVGYLDEVYDNILCSGYQSISGCPTGTGVSVTQGTVTSNVNFTLASGGAISGRVTDEGGTGLSNVLVYVFEKTTGGVFNTVSYAYTNNAGDYKTYYGLPGGTYYLHTSNAPTGYVNEVYDNVACSPYCSLSAGTGVSVTTGVTTPNINFALPLARLVLPAGDYDGDGKADVAVFRLSTGVWYIVRSSTGAGVSFTWGASGDVPVPADYDGDGKTDAAVFRPSTATWYVLQTTTGAGVSVRWGAAGDLAVPADYDGDGKADVAVFRAGTWYIIRSSTGVASAISWGQGGDVPVPADFDGDGKADPTVFRSGTWYQLRSATGSGFAVNWGQSGDVALAADFDGDGKADPTVFRSSTWYQFRSATGTGFSVNWGGSGDLPTAGDYDGDNKADPTVFRPGAGVWYELRSTTGSGFGITWGSAGDLPV